MDAVQAQAVLDDVAGVRDRARADRRPTSLPLLTFGALAAGDALLRLRFDTNGLWWTLAAPAGFAFLAWTYRRREIEIGVGTRGGAYRGWAVGLLVAALLFPLLVLFGAPLVLAGLGLGMIAWRQRNGALGAWAAFLVVFAVLDGSRFLENRLYEAASSFGWYRSTSGYFDWAGALVAAVLAVALLAGGVLTRRREDAGR